MQGMNVMMKITRTAISLRLCTSYRILTGDEPKKKIKRVSKNKVSITKTTEEAETQ